MQPSRALETSQSRAGAEVNTVVWAGSDDAPPTAGWHSSSSSIASPTSSSSEGGVRVIQLRDAPPAQQQPQQPSEAVVVPFPTFSSDGGPMSHHHHPLAPDDDRDVPPLHPLVGRNSNRNSSNHLRHVSNSNNNSFGPADSLAMAPSITTNPVAPGVFNPPQSRRTAATMNASTSVLGASGFASGTPSVLASPSCLSMNMSRSRSTGLAGTGGGPYSPASSLRRGGPSVHEESSRRSGGLTTDHSPVQHMWSSLSSGVTATTGGLGSIANMSLSKDPGSLSMLMPSILPIAGLFGDDDDDGIEYNPAAKPVMSPEVNSALAGFLPPPPPAYSSYSSSSNTNNNYSAAGEGSMTLCPPDERPAKEGAAAAAGIAATSGASTSTSASTPPSRRRRMSH